jgi:porin
MGLARAQDAPNQPATYHLSGKASPTPAPAKQRQRNAVTRLLATLLTGPICYPATELFSGLFPQPINDKSQVTTNLRPFLLTLPQDHLWGNWGGLSPALADMGITPTLTYVTDIAGNVTGGKNQGAAYADNIGLNVLFDLDKLAGVEGGSLLVSMSQRDGSSLSQTHVGNAFTIQQDYGGESFKLIDLAYQQKLLDDRVELRLGRLAAGDDFLVSPYDYLFMQNGFDGNPVGIFFNAPGMTAYPDATWGALMKVKPTARTYVMGGIYNGDPSIHNDDRYGVDFSMHGPAYAMAEFGYRRNGLPGDSQLLGNYKAGFWYDNSNYTSYKPSTSGRPTATTRGNWGFYGLFDQVLLPFGLPGCNRGFGIFGCLMVSPDETISQLPYFFTAGFAFRGIFASRPTDSGGFGVVYGDFSSDLREAEEQDQVLDPGSGVKNYETALEWTYRFYFRNSALFFQPDVQYIIKPGGTGNIGNALVLGCQIGVNF